MVLSVVSKAAPKQCPSLDEPHYREHPRQALLCTVLTKGKKPNTLRVFHVELYSRQPYKSIPWCTHGSEQTTIMWHSSLNWTPSSPASFNTPGLGLTVRVGRPHTYRNIWSPARADPPHSGPWADRANGTECTVPDVMHSSDTVPTRKDDNRTQTGSPKGAALAGVAFRQTCRAEAWWCYYYLRSCRPAMKWNENER